MRRILGVNFSPGGLHAAVIESRFGMARPVKSEDVVMPEKPEEHAGFITDTFIRWKKEHLPDGVVIGLPLQHFSHHLVDMPAMGRADMKKALLFEMEKYLPLPVEEYIFDFLAMPAEKGRVKALVFSVKRDYVNSVLKPVKEAGMDILSIRCRTLSALAGLLDVAGEKAINGIFVTITDSSYEIAGLKNSMPAYMKGFMKKIDLSLELERLMVLYPGKVYFTGNIAPSIAEKFNSRKFEISVPNALAGSEVKKTFLNLDFLPEEFARKKKDPYPYIVGGLAAASLVVFLLTGLVAYYKEWSALRTIEERRAALKSKSSGVIEARRKLNLLQNDRKVLMGFAGRSNLATKVLADLSEVLPNNVWLINVSIDDKGKVEIEGFTQKTANLVDAFEKSKAFTKVSFSAPIIAKEGEERFALKMEAAF